MQAELYDKPLKICQKFKNRKIFYGCLTPTNISELKPWGMLHVKLLCTYNKSIRKNHLYRANINNDVILTCINMINPATGWFEIFKVLTFDIDKVKGGNDECINKSSARVIQLSNNTWARVSA